MTIDKIANDPDAGQHTPGPWRHHVGNHGEYLVSCESGGYAPLARVKGDKRSTLKSAHANARMIAAAPELLEALYAMMENCYDLELSDEIARAVELGRNAIAKAEGFR